MRTGLIAGAAALIVVMIFIIQNAHAVNVTFLGAHLHLSLAVALLLAAIAGALAMAAAGTTRIAQLPGSCDATGATRTPAKPARTIPPGTPPRAAQAPDRIPGRAARPGQHRLPVTTHPTYVTD